MLFAGVAGRGHGQRAGATAARRRSDDVAPVAAPPRRHDTRRREARAEAHHHRRHHRQDDHDDARRTAHALLNLLCSSRGCSLCSGSASGGAVVRGGSMEGRSGLFIAWRAEVSARTAREIKMRDVLCVRAVRGPRGCVNG